MHPALHGLFATALIKQRSALSKSRVGSGGSDVVSACYNAWQAKLGVLRRVSCVGVRVFSAKINKGCFSGEEEK